MFARREHLLDELGKPQARPVALTAPGIDIRQVAMAAETITTVHHHKELLSVGQLDGQGNALPLQALEVTARGDALHLRRPTVTQAVFRQGELFDQAIEQRAGRRQFTDHIR
ncbi:hypothetical protein D3C85_1687680 [compost metagenome]